MAFINCGQWATPQSHEALKIVNRLDNFLDFELIKGNMDDVFLTVTGHTEVPK